MKSFLNILLNGTILCVMWIISSLMINSLLGVSPPEASDPGSALALMWLCCVLEAGALHFYVVNLRYEKVARLVIIFVTLFFIQFVFTQIESWYYIDQQTLPKEIIMSTVLAGLITSLAFTLFVGYRYPAREVAAIVPKPADLIPNLLILGILVYPMIYFAAGYYIAWQWEPLRIYYTGSSEMTSFYQTMASNFKQGIVTFQVVRGLVWAMVACFILRSIQPVSWKRQGLILGLLFAALMSAQLLIPNPYMPTDIRLVHLVETGVSNLIWGFLMAFGWHLAMRKSTVKAIAQ